MTTSKIQSDGNYQHYVTPKNWQYFHLAETMSVSFGQIWLCHAKKPRKNQIVFDENHIHHIFSTSVVG
jgi:hypothetical protein